MASDSKQSLASKPLSAAEKNSVAELLQPGLADFSLRELLSMLLSSMGAAERKAYLERIADDCPNGFSGLPTSM